MKKLIFQILAAGLGLWIATIFVSGVVVKLYPDSNFFGFNLTAQWQIFLLLGIILGLINYFIKPILDTITFPLRIITLGLFSFVISMALIWVVDILFKELSVPFLYPLLWTTLIIWGLNIFSQIFLAKED